MTPALTIILSVLSSISAFLYLVMILGYIFFKDLRKNNGSLILAIAIANLTLSLHWILSSFIDDLNQEDTTPCLVNGCIAIFAGFLVYSYNLALIASYKRKLTDLVRVDLFSKLITHGLCIGLSSLATLYLQQTDEIGPDFAKMCAKKFHPEIEVFSGVMVIIFILAYEACALYLFFHIKKAFPVALASNIQARRYLDHSRLYLIITSIFWPVLAFIDSYTEFTSNEDLPISLIPVYNICSILQSLTITFYWYREPIIEKTVKKFFCLGRKKIEPRGDEYHQISDGKSNFSSIYSSELNSGEVDINIVPNDQGKQDNEADKSIEQDFMVDYFQRNRKVDMTYSIISSLLTACKILDSNIYTRSTNLKLRETTTYEIDQNLVFEEIPAAKNEFKEAKCAFMPIKIHIIAPSIFKELASQDSIELAKSLNLKKNRKFMRDNKRPDGGKTPEFFFFSRDHKLLIKSIPDSDLDTLQKILPNYYQHHQKNPNSLITRLYGIFKLEFIELNFALNLIIMRSVCQYANKYIEKRFDLKGSEDNRTVLPRKESLDYSQIMKSKTLKDMDFDQVEKYINLEDEVRQPLFNVINEDVEFLCREGLIDYSLILFIVNHQKYVDERREHSVVPEEMIHRNPFMSIPFKGKPGFCYNLGIIDFLGTYNIKKKLEKTAKTMKNIVSGARPSVNDPENYKAYFRDYAKKILKIGLEVSQTEAEGM